MVSDIPFYNLSDDTLRRNGWLLKKNFPLWEINSVLSDNAYHQAKRANLWHWDKVGAALGGLLGAVIGKGRKLKF